MTKKTLTAANHSTRSTASTKAEENSNNSSTAEKGNKKQICNQPLDYQKNMLEILLMNPIKLKSPILTTLKRRKKQFKTGFLVGLDLLVN